MLSTYKFAYHERDRCENEQRMVFKTNQSITKLLNLRLHNQLIKQLARDFQNWKRAIETVNIQILRKSNVRNLRSACI